MPFAIQQLISRGYWAPAGDDGAAGGGGDSVDRGDDFKSPLDNAGKGDKLDDEDDKSKDKGDLDKEGDRHLAPGGPDGEQYPRVPPP